MKQNPRSSGLLLHVTSLPNRFGIGDLGPGAYQWIDLLARAGQRWWQMLPLQPTDGHHSPYQALSAFAGNPLLISPEILVRDGWVDSADLSACASPSHRVDYPFAIKMKSNLLNRAYSRYRTSSSSRARDAFQKFRDERAAWLDDFALFMALRDARPSMAWQQWPRELATRKKSALRSVRRELADSIEQHQFVQFLFFSQLQELRRYATKKRVGFIGDLPIFVSLQSADVWASPHLFQLDRDLKPTATSGVPPDLFCDDGQSWGNPLYDWPRMKREQFGWWIARMRAALGAADIVRLDHFRGFEAYWSIPAGSASAREGRWIKSPGQELFASLRRELGKLPVIAEDLGMITPEVYRLRDRFSLPGMRVLQFAFDGDSNNPHLPHNFTQNSVVYTGTHDNDTTVSWFAQLNRKQKNSVRRYAPELGKTRDAAWSLARLAWSSVAQLAVAPVQDILSLSGEARMNYPGRPSGNWRWRLDDFKSCEEPFSRLREMTGVFGRATQPVP